MIKISELLLDNNKLKELIRQCKHLNIAPIYLPEHLYQEKPPISSLLKELVKECVYLLSILEENEFLSFFHSLSSYAQKKFDYEDIPQRINKEDLALYYIVDEVERTFNQFKNVINEELEKSEVLKVYPELKVHIDKDSLFNINSSFKLCDTGIQYKDHILVYHQLLRRKYTSNFNFDFTRKFFKYFIKMNSENTFRIAIDHNRIMPKERYERLIEEDRWYGPPFSLKNIDEPTGELVTVIGNNNSDINNDLIQTEFYWSYKNGIKTFQVEELSDKSYLFENYYFNRYIHSERDINKKNLRHIDGAVKVYLKNDYGKRLNTRMPDEFKSYKKIKLFRIDGNIDLNTWVELISYFYKANKMVIEYFTNND